MNNTIPRILTDYKSQISNYPEALKFQELQQANFWKFNEVNLEKDIQYIITEIDVNPEYKNARFGILETLKLFTIYETKADCFWSDVVVNMFPDPDIKAMARYFGGIELSIHRNAYNELNKLLNVANDEFYNSYKQSDFLVDRMNFIDHYLENGTNLEKIATLCFAEGVILFSSFAFLMSFRANGFNLLPNVGLVIKFSAKDEDCVDGETEVLTKNGWLRIDELNEGVEIAQFDEDDRSIEFVVPEKIIKKPYNGTMYEFENEHYSLLCTENHKILYYDKDDKPQKIEAKDFIDSVEHKVPTFSNDMRIRCSSSKTDKGIIKKDWNDYVYCVTVPTHNFLIRRKDKVSVTGNCHNLASSWLFKTLKREYEELGQKDDTLYDKIIDIANQIKEHEFKIIESIFSRGSIPTIKKEDLESFILARIDVCLIRMGYKPIHNVTNFTVAKWFDDILINLNNNDFFAGQGSGYTRDYSKEDFHFDIETYNKSKQLGVCE